MIRDADSKFGDYSISPKIRQMLLHWGYRFFLMSWQIKMSYSQFNRQEILQKATEKYCKEKCAEYYAQNKKTIKVKRAL